MITRGFFRKLQDRTVIPSVITVGCCARGIRRVAVIDPARRLQGRNAEGFGYILFHVGFLSIAIVSSVPAVPFLPLPPVLFVLLLVLPLILLILPV